MEDEKPRRAEAIGQKATDSEPAERVRTLRLPAMLVVIGMLALALLFLIPVGVSLRSSGRSRRHPDSLLVGLFAGVSTVGLVSVWIAVIAFFIPEILTTGVGLLAAFVVAIAAPAAMIWLTPGWLRADHQ